MIFLPCDHLLTGKTGTRIRMSLVPSSFLWSRFYFVVSNNVHGVTFLQYILRINFEIVRSQFIE
jgi:hypothetical protein